MCNGFPQSKPRDSALDIVILCNREVTPGVVLRHPKGWLPHAVFLVFVCRAPSALLEDFERDEVVVPVEEVDPVVGVVPPVGVVVPVVVAEDNHVGYLE